MADLEDIYKKFFDESGNMKESGKKIVSEGMKGISSKNPLIGMTEPEFQDHNPANIRGKKSYKELGIKNEDDFFKKAGERKAVLNEKNNALRSTTKTLTEQGFFQPKSLKAAETIGKAAKATRIGKIAAGVAAAGYGVKKYLESKMSKPEAEDVEKKSKGGMNKYSKGKQIKLSDAMKQSDLPNDYFKSLGLFPLVPREKKEDVEKKSTGDFIKRRKELAGADSLKEIFKTLGQFPFVPKEDTKPKDVEKKSTGDYIKRRKKLAGVDSLGGDDMSDTSDYIKRRKKLAGVDSLSKGKSVKGYGQARKSGMGLEDENVSLGKGSDYIKDLL